MHEYIANLLQVVMLDTGIHMVKIITRILLLSKPKEEELEDNLIQMPEEMNTLFTQMLTRKTHAKNTKKQDECLKRTLKNEEDSEEWIISREHDKTKMHSKSLFDVRQKCVSIISNRCMGSNREIRIEVRVVRIEKMNKEMNGTNILMKIMILCTKLMLWGSCFVFLCGAQQ